MTLQSFGHPLNTLNNGVVAFAENIRSTPRMSMNISVCVQNGMAKVVMSRSFENQEEAPIEAILTFPVSFQAVITSLKAKIDGVELTAKARLRDEARTAYEDAIDRGKLAVLHEEPLRGLHLISIAPLRSKQTVVVVAEYMMPLANINSMATLHIPTTVGELYGNSPLLPVDDIAVGNNALRKATLEIDALCGKTLIHGALVGHGPLEIDLNRQIILSFPDAIFGKLNGYDAWGRRVAVTLEKEQKSTRPLNLIVLFDRSGSTGTHIDKDGSTVWSCMRNGLRKSLQCLSESDAVSLWQFDSSCQKIGSAKGAKSAELVDGIEIPKGGTELGAAIQQIKNERNAKDILILTDGQTWAVEAQSIAAMGYRISAVLVGEDSFEGVIGQLAFMTGGEVFPGDGGDVAPAISSALQSLRTNSASVEGRIVDGKPTVLRTKRAGVAMSISWGDELSSELCDQVGGYAAAIALPLIEGEKAGDYAASHNLCTHLTSLLLIDEEGKTTPGIPEQRKIQLAGHAPFPKGYARVGGLGIALGIAHVSDASQLVNSGWERASWGDVFHALDIWTSTSSIDWDNLAREVWGGNISGLSLSPGDIVGDLVVNPEIRGLADKLGIDSIIVAIALIAKCHSEQTAQRVARRILAKASRDDLKEPLKIAKRLMLGLGA